MSRDDDLLERATRALRATPPPDDGELAQVKLRMLAAHQAATKKGSRRTLRWVLPLAAVLAAGSALAAVPHGIERLTAVVNRVVGFEILAAAPKLAEPSRRKAASKAPQLAPPASVTAAEPVAAEPTVADAAPSTEAVPSEPAAPSELARSESAASTATPSEQALAGASRHARTRKREASSTPAVAPAASEPAPVVAPEPAPEPAEEPAPIASADLAKYRAAHKAHFQQRDFALALRNWEAYLRQYPNGTFAIEARYNRAICLLRLGRKDEARRALTPFANGEIGRGYREAEATKLLEALE